MQHKFIKVEGQEEMSNDFHREIWFGNEYEQYGISIENGDVVLDCGTNIGLFTDYALFKGATQVFNFEADQKTYDIYQQNFPSSKYPNIKSNLGKVGYGDGLINMRDIFDICGVTSFDFAKIDIEGFEYDLLLNTPDTMLKHINKWAIEFHLWGYWKNTATEMKFLLQIIEKFNRSGFNTYLKYIHSNTNLIMFYANKR